MMKAKLFRISTVPMSLNLLLRGQLKFLNQYFEVTAISGEGDELSNVERREGVKIHSVEMHRPISIKQDWISLWQLYRYFKKEKPDIIHSITPKAGLLSMVAGKLAGVPIRIHTFTGLIFPHRQGYLRTILLVMDKILCMCATHIYPEGIGVRNDLIKGKITNKPLKVIANGNINGVDLEYFDKTKVTPEEKQNLKNSLGIKDEDFIYVFVGRIVIDKGIRELVEAFDKINKADANIKLILVGPRENEDNPEKKLIFEIIKENKNIIEVGYQENVRAYYSLGNVFVMPSYREGFPNTVLEAGAMSLPCIVTNINGSNEIIENNKNGIIVPPKNEKELEIAMLRLLNDQNLLINLQENARKIINDRFNKNIVWKALLEEYQLIMKK